MLIGFNNIHFSWKETILLIEERRERREGARDRGKKKKKKKGFFSFSSASMRWRFWKKRSTGSELMKLSDAGRGKKESPN